MRSEDVVSPTIQSWIFPCKNTDWVGKGRACEGACHAVMMEVMGMSIYVRIPFKYAACFGFRFTYGPFVYFLQRGMLLRRPFVST